MGRMTINGITIEADGDVVISGGRVQVGGRTIDGIDLSGGLARVEVNGDLRSLRCDGSAEIRGDVHGPVTAGSRVQCGDVQGSVTAGSSVQCGDVGGGCIAGSSIRRRM